ncbi:MAG: tRNA (adenine-N1)-methyltransferase [Syntrophobacteraceae bacterium]|nr:tRNA (adenine-N1)-methyltransferase [Syntrophobacteraceae bacterium]
MSAFRPGEWALLISQKGKKWLVKVEDAPYSSHLGTVQMRDVQGKEEGEFLETNKGAKLYLFRPTLEDFIFTMKRQTQIIYPKDLGAMVFHGDIQPGQTILESGIGSGALTLALLRALCGTGRLISVEKRPEFARLARSNITRFFGRHPDNHEIVVGDIQDFAMTVKADRIFLDLPEPWHAVGPVSVLLRQGGILVSLSPNIGQVQLVHKELKASGFANVWTFELLKREWKIDERRARPVDRMVAHTGFITVARKTPVYIDSESEA